MTAPAFESHRSLDTPITEVSPCDSLLQELQEFEAQVYSGELFDACANKELNSKANLNNATQTKSGVCTASNGGDNGLINFSPIKASQSDRRGPRLSAFRNSNTLGLIPVSRESVVHNNSTSRTSLIPRLISQNYPNTLYSTNEQKQQTTSPIVVHTGDTETDHPCESVFHRSSTPVNYNEGSLNALDITSSCCGFTGQKSITVQPRDHVNSGRIVNEHFKVRQFVSSKQSDAEKSVEEDPIQIHDMVVAKLADDGAVWGPPLLAEQSPRRATNCIFKTNNTTVKSPIRKANLNYRVNNSINNSSPFCFDEQVESDSSTKISSSNCDSKPAIAVHSQTLQNRSDRMSVSYHGDQNSNKQSTDMTKSEEDANLRVQLEQALLIRKQQDDYIKQLQTYYDNLLTKHALAEVTIDQLRMGKNNEPNASSDLNCSVSSISHGRNNIELKSRSLYSLNKTNAFGVTDQHKVISNQPPTMRSRFGVSENQLNSSIKMTNNLSYTNNAFDACYSRNHRLQHRDADDDNTDVNNNGNHVHSQGNTPYRSYNPLRHSIGSKNRVYSSDRINSLSRQHSCTPHRTNATNVVMRTNSCRQMDLNAADNRFSERSRSVKNHRILSREQLKSGSRSSLCEEASSTVNQDHILSDRMNYPSRNQAAIDDAFKTQRSNVLNNRSNANSKSTSHTSPSPPDLHLQLQKFLLDGPETIQMELLLRITDLQTRLSNLELTHMQGRWITLQSDLINLQTDYETLNDFYDLAKRYWDRRRKHGSQNALQFDANHVLHSILAQFQDRLNELIKFVHMRCETVDQYSCKPGHDQLKVYRMNNGVDWDNNEFHQSVNDESEADEDDADDAEEDEKENVDVNADDAGLRLLDEQEQETDEMIHKTNTCNQPVHDSGVLSSPSSLPSRSEIGRCSSNSPHIQSPIIEESFSKLESVYLELMQHYNKIKQLPMTPHRMEQLYKLMKRLYDLALTADSHSNIIASPEELESMFQLDGDTRKLSEDLDRAIALQKQLTKCEASGNSNHNADPDQLHNDEKYNDNNNENSPFMYPVNKSSHVSSVHNPTTSRMTSSKHQSNRSNCVNTTRQDASSNQDSGLSTPPDSFDGMKSRVRSHLPNSSVMVNKRSRPVHRSKVVKRHIDPAEMLTNENKSGLSESVNMVVNSLPSDYTTRRIMELENTVLSLKKSISRLSSKITTDNVVTNNHMADTRGQTSTGEVGMNQHEVMSQLCMDHQPDICASCPPTDVYPTRIYRRNTDQKLYNPQSVQPANHANHPVIKSPVSSGRSKFNSFQKLDVHTIQRSSLPNKVSVDRFSNANDTTRPTPFNDQAVISECSVEESPTLGSPITDESNNDDSYMADETDILPADVFSASRLRSCQPGITRLTRVSSKTNPVNQELHTRFANEVHDISPLLSPCSYTCPHPKSRLHYRQQQRGQHTRHGARCGSMSHLNLTSSENYHMNTQLRLNCDPGQINEHTIRKNLSGSMPHIAHNFCQPGGSRVYSIHNESVPQTDCDKGTLHWYPTTHRLLYSHTLSTEQLHPNNANPCRDGNSVNSSVLRRCDTCDGRGHVLLVDGDANYFKPSEYLSNAPIARPSFAVNSSRRRTLSTSKMKVIRSGPVRATHTTINCTFPPNDNLLECRRLANPQDWNMSSQPSYSSRKYDQYNVSEANLHLADTSSGFVQQCHRMPSSRHQKFKQTKSSNDEDCFEQSKRCYPSSNINVMRENYSTHPNTRSPTLVSSPLFSLKEALKSAAMTSQLAHQLRQSLEDLCKPK